MDERTEIQFLTLGKSLLNLVGHDAYIEMVVKMTLPLEAGMRITHPDSPALVVLDEWRERQVYAK